MHVFGSDPILELIWVEGVWLNCPVASTRGIELQIALLSPVVSFSDLLQYLLTYARRWCLAQILVSLTSHVNSS